MVFLQEFDRFRTAVLQCHDNPDIDTIACAFALTRYLESRGTVPAIVYGGWDEIKKPNIALFVQSLGIPIRFVGRTAARVEDLPEADSETLLITVDCQYGAGNVTPIESGRVCVIDHHLPENRPCDFSRIEPALGSCATLVWRLLREAGFDFKRHQEVATALYYGLYTDTNSLAEIRHPFDKDMLESLSYDAGLIKTLKSNNLTRGEILVAGRALHAAHYDDRRGTALFAAEPCDPNILGFISDLTMQVAGIDVCVGLCEINGGIKLSIRSATGAVMANELAGHLSRGLGAGGGNKEKAGGFLRLPPGEATPRDFILKRLNDYFDDCDHVRAGEYRPDPTAMNTFIKKSLTVGYVEPGELYPHGTEVLVRTLEGDAVFEIDRGSLLMVGVQGEVYPIKRDKFEIKYRPLDGPFAFDPAFTSEAFYEPTIRDTLSHRPLNLGPHIRPCRPAGAGFIYARRLERACKVFTPWYTGGYMAGSKGDYLAMSGDDQTDIYIVKASIFGHTYYPATDGGN